MKENALVISVYDKIMDLNVLSEIVATRLPNFDIMVVTTYENRPLFLRSLAATIDPKNISFVQVPYHNKFFVDCRVVYQVLESLRIALAREYRFVVFTHADGWLTGENILSLRQRLEKKESYFGARVLKRYIQDPWGWVYGLDDHYILFNGGQILSDFGKDLAINQVEQKQKLLLDMFNSGYEENLHTLLTYCLMLPFIRFNKETRSTFNSTKHNHVDWMYKLRHSEWLQGALPKSAKTVDFELCLFKSARKRQSKLWIYHFFPPYTTLYPMHADYELGLVHINTALREDKRRFIKNDSNAAPVAIVPERIQAKMDLILRIEAAENPHGDGRLTDMPNVRQFMEISKQLIEEARRGPLESFQDSVKKANKEVSILTDKDVLKFFYLMPEQDA